MKDETCGLSIKGFAGLESKMYTFITEVSHESKEAKGVNKNVVDGKLKYEDYKNVLISKSYMRHERNNEKIIILDRVELINLLYLLFMTKKIYN